MRQCLGALQSQTLSADEFEIVVADNGSTDDTVSIAREFTSHVHTFPRVTVGALRNSGAAAARGDILAFIDADCIAHPGWLEGARTALVEGGVAVGNKYDRPAGDGWIEALWLGDVPPGRVRTQELWAGNLVLPRANFVECGGFDETLVSYEDVWLADALARRGPLYFDDRVRVTHIGGPRTLAAFARQQLWHGFEEWTLYRRGMTRDTLVPTLVCLAGYVLLPCAALFKPPGTWGVFVLGVAAILGASLWRVQIQRPSHPSPSWRTVWRLLVLNVVSLSARALAVVLRALHLHWSGRVKAAPPGPAQ